MFFIYGILSTFFVTFLHLGYVNIIKLQNYWVTFGLLLIITILAEMIIFIFWIEMIKKKQGKIKLRLVSGTIVAAILTYLYLYNKQHMHVSGMVEIEMGVFLVFTLPSLVIKVLIDFYLINKNIKTSQS